MSTVNDFLSNEITRAIAKIDETFAVLPADALAELDEGAHMDAGDLIFFGDIPTRMHQAGLVSLAGAQALHAIHRNFVNESVAARWIFLHVMAESRGKC